MALDANTYGFVYALGLGLVVGTIVLLVFCVIRPKVPDVFQHRRLLNTWKSHDDFNGTRVGLTHPPPSNSFLGWFSPTFFTPEDQILRKVGLDAVVFLRFLRSAMLIVVAIALIGSILLMPTYGTAGNKRITDPNDPNFVEGLRIISLGNVEARSARLWVTVIVEYLVTCIVLYFMITDFQHYTKLRRQYRVSENPVNYALAVLDIPEDCRNETAIRDRFELIVPHQIAEVVLIRQCAAAVKLQKKLDTAVMKRELAEYIKSVKGVSPETRPGFCGCCMCHKPKVDALEYWEGEQSRLTKEVEDQSTEAAQCAAAVVILTNKRAAALLAQANIASNATSWNIERAPEPLGVHWPAFKIPGYQAEARTFAVGLFMIAFTLLWTIPATAIVGLFNLRQLAKNSAFSFLDTILDWSPAISGLLEGLLPPTVLAVLISLIPALFRFVVGHERQVSRAVIERKTRDYFYFFTLYGSFFVIVLGSSFMSQSKEIIDDPQLIIDALAKEVPGNGVLFATFLLVKALIPLPLMVSGIVRCILRWIFLKLAKTERQKRKARSGGNLFQYFRYSGDAMLMLFICIMFSTMSPIVPVAGLFYFGLANLVFRYQILFTTHQPWDGGGFLFIGSFWGTVIGLVLQQVVVVAIIALKKAPAQTIVCAIPPIVTLLISLLVKKRYASLSENGSLHDMYQETSKLDEIPAQYNGIYEQPAGLITKYENLNGVEDFHDVYSDVSFDDADNLDGLQSEHHDENVGYVPDRAADRSEV